MEIFKKFKIKDLIQDPLYIKNIKWDHEGLKVDLESDSNLDYLTILFDETVYLYQDTAEAYKVSWHIDSESDYYPFYYSKNSEMIDKLRKDVEYIRGDEVIHFVIISLDDVVDVLTSDLPKIFYC